TNIPQLGTQGQVLKMVVYAGLTIMGGMCGCIIVEEGLKTHSREGDGDNRGLRTIFVRLVPLLLEVIKLLACFCWLAESSDGRVEDVVELMVLSANTGIEFVYSEAILFFGHGNALRW